MAKKQAAMGGRKEREGDGEGGGVRGRADKADSHKRVAFCVIHSEQCKARKRQQQQKTDKQQSTQNVNWKTKQREEKRGEGEGSAERGARWAWRLIVVVVDRLLATAKLN